MNFYLLSDFGDWAEYGQFAAAIVAVLLTIISMIQTKKIKELSDITSELANQTKQLAAQTTELIAQNHILTQRLSLELSLSLDQRMPIFEPDGIVSAEIGCRYQVHLRNVGKKAFKIKLLFAENENFTFSNTPIDSCGKGESFFLDIQYLTSEAYQKIAFNFHISFYDNSNIQYSQRIWQHSPGNDFFVGLPEPILIANQEFPITRRFSTGPSVF